jgi:hypothetical protein
LRDERKIFADGEAADTFMERGAVAMGEAAHEFFEVSRASEDLAHFDDFAFGKWVIHSLSDVVRRGQQRTD